MQDFELPFGFGRRICPGMHLARNSITISIERLCWGFDITPARDPATGAPILPDTMNYTDGFNSKPVSFECTITVRNPKIEETIRSEWKATKGKLGSWEW